MGIIWFLAGVAIGWFGHIIYLLVKENKELKKKMGLPGSEDKKRIELANKRVSEWRKNNGKDNNYNA